MNQFAVRTRNQNLLRTKTKNFKTNHQQTQHRIRVSSSLNNLAGKLYSTSYNEGFSPKKSRVISQTPNKQKQKKGGLNPELPLLTTDMLVKSTLSMSGLSMRASHIPGFADLNTSLLLEKLDLEKNIKALRQAIAHENKLLNQANYQCKKTTNEKNKFRDFYLQANAKSKDLNQKIHRTLNEIYELKQDNRELRQKIAQRNDNINKQRKWCDNLEKQVRTLKMNAMHEEKQRNKVKGELQKAQRVMESASIYCKELENERAGLLLSINESVSLNKL